MATDARRELFRLLDLYVEEVSIVDRAANRRRWLVLKRRGETMEFKELIDALATMPRFAESLGADEQSTLADALRKAADGIQLVADPVDGSDPAPVEAQKGEEVVDVNAEPDPSVDGVQKVGEPERDPMAPVLSALAGLQQTIGAVATDVRAIDARLSKVEKSVDVPLAGVIESTGTEEAGNPNARPIPWEMDLNAE